MLRHFNTVYPLIYYRTHITEKLHGPVVLHVHTSLLFTFSSVDAKRTVMRCKLVCRGYPRQNISPLLQYHITIRHYLTQMMQGAMYIT